MKELKILITNDDGIHAPGIFHLWKTLRPLSRPAVVAPAIEQSGMGMAITVRSPLYIQKATLFDETDAWGVTGTPADCVKLATSSLLKEIPDLLVSGINSGSNAGGNVLFSGTVGAAIEATLKGIPAIAFSCYDIEQPFYEEALPYIPKIIEYVLKHPLPKGTLLNVNFPPRSCQGIRGFKMARQGNQRWIEDPDHRMHPTEERSYYWLGAKLSDHQEEEGTDIYWLARGYVAAVPVYVGELTDHRHLASHSSSFEGYYR